MSSKAVRAALVAAILVVCRNAGAQALNVEATPPDANVVSSSIGVDDAFVGTLGFSHAVALESRTVMLGGDATLPWMKPDLGDYRVRLFGLAPLIGSGSWRVLGELAPGLRGDRSEMNRMTNLELEGDVLAGRYANHWFMSAELGGDWAAATYIKHSERYRRTVYAAARDGWYRTTGATVHAGLMGGVSFGSVDLVLRLGQERDQQLKPLLIPAYVTLGLNVRLPL